MIIRPSTKDYPRDRCLHQLFEEQAERTPDAVAVVFEDGRLTYRELNDKANQLAHHLRNLGVGPEVLVGICVERSLEMVIGMLGILKAGGAYRPLDPEYPRERLALMLDDARVKVLLTQEPLLAQLPAPAADVVCLDRDSERLADESQENLAPLAAAENIACVIYTSGSTGQPKGCLVTHYNVVRLFLATENWFRLPCRRRLDVVPFGRLRFFGLGDVGRFPLWRAIGDRSPVGQSVAGCILQVAGRSTGHGTEPDSLGIRAADGRGTGERRRGRGPAIARI